MAAVVIIWLTFPILMTLNCKALAEITVHLNEYNHSKSTTLCTKDLLNSDTIVLHGRISFKKIDLSSEISIYAVKKGITLEIILVNKENCSNRKNARFTCNINGNEIHTTYKTPVNTDYSDEPMQLRVVVGNMSYSSQPVTLPGVYDPAKINLTLNEKTIQDNSNFDIDENNNTITICCSKGPKPCIPIILGIPSGQKPPKESGSCVTYIPTSTDITHYIIGYSVCGIENVKKYTVQINYKKGNLNVPKEEDGDSIIIMICLFAALLIIVSILICLYLYKRRTNNNRPQRNNREPAAPEDAGPNPAENSPTIGRNLRLDQDEHNVEEDVDHKKEIEKLLSTML